MQLCHQGDKHASELADAKAECEPSVEPSLGKQYPFPASEMHDMPCHSHVTTLASAVSCIAQQSHHPGMGLQA